VGSGGLETAAREGACEGVCETAQGERGLQLGRARDGGAREGACEGRLDGAGQERVRKRPALDGGARDRRARDGVGQGQARRAGWERVRARRARDSGLETSGLNSAGRGRCNSSTQCPWRPVSSTGAAGYDVAGGAM